MQTPVEADGDLTRVDVWKRVEGFLSQPLQKEGAVVRIGTQQPDGAIAAPSPQHEVLVFGLRVLAADLQDGACSL
jgi:hypothetical protein